jgi:uncharacterized coiled-coil protein SlyX
MKKAKSLFVISAFAFLLCGLSLRAYPGELAGRDTIQRQANSLQSEAQSLRIQYNSILQEPKPNVMPRSGILALPINGSMPLNSTGNELSNLLIQGSDLFGLLDQQLTALQEQLANSEITITDLRKLLSESLETIAALRGNLNQVSERMQASNEWLAAAYDDIDLLEKQNADLKIQNEKLAASVKRGGIIGFSFGGIAFGAGVPLVIEGVRMDNQTMMWAGAGVLIGTGGIWALGHYLLDWW